MFLINLIVFVERTGGDTPHRDNFSVVVVFVDIHTRLQFWFKFFFKLFFK